MTGLAASLVWMGPGTIWPIVLLVSSVLTACTVLAGISVGRPCGSTHGGGPCKAALEGRWRGVWDDFRNYLISAA